MREATRSPKLDDERLARLGAWLIQPAEDCRGPARRAYPVYFRIRLPEQICRLSKCPSSSACRSSRDRHRRQPVARCGGMVRRCKRSMAAISALSSRYSSLVIVTLSGAHGRAGPRRPLYPAFPSSTSQGEHSGRGVTDRTSSPQPSQNSSSRQPSDRLTRTTAACADDLATPSSKQIGHHTQPPAR